jgi:hypothetical protein
MVVGFLLVVAAATAYADPIIVIPPVSHIEVVDFAPLDGMDLSSATSEFVALGPGGETRVIYSFPLAPLSAASPKTPIVFAATRTGFNFSSCADLTPCPDLTRFDIYGFASDGTVGIGNYNSGLFLKRFFALPAPGKSITLDVTGFVTGLRAANVDFAGFAVRAASNGAMQLADARLAATPEPGSLTLLALGGVAGLARRRFARR